MSSANRLPRLLAIAVFAALAVLALAGSRAWEALEVARGREAELVARIAQEEETVRLLRHRVERLQHDPLTLETTAREELGWVRPGDLVVIFEREPAVMPVMHAPSTASPR